MSWIGKPLLDAPANYCVHLLKFRVYEHDISCASEINNNSGLKRGMWNFALQPLKTWDLHYHTACSQQNLTWMVTYHEGRSSLKSHAHEELLVMKLLDCSISRFWEVTWHIKYFISPLALDQWPSNMVRWWLFMRDFHP